ncbi:hypothetical protein VTO73DRAFT_9815 [Trametes versicolor]
MMESSNIHGYLVEELERHLSKSDFKRSRYPKRCWFPDSQASARIWGQPHVHGFFAFQHDAIIHLHSPALMVLRSCDPFVGVPWEMSAPGNTTSAGVPPNPLALLPKVPALDNTFGALLIGTFVGLILYGLTLHQSYRYLRLYPNDSRALKCLVAFVVLLETITSVFSMHVCYFYLTTNYFNPEALLHGVWSLNLFPVASGIIMISAQSFFARRVWHLGARISKVVVLFAMLAAKGALCIVEIGFFIGKLVPLCEILLALIFHSKRHSGVGRSWLVSTGSTMAVTADMTLTAALIVFLHRSRTGLKRTDTMIDILILYSVNTGLLTGILNLLSLLFAFIRPGDLIYIGFGIVGAKMYATTLLAALNSRQSLASHGSGISNDTNPFGFGGTAALHVSRTRGVSQVHAPQLRPSRTEETSVIELKVPSHFGDSVQLGAETADEIDLPRSDASSQYRRAADENV